MRVLVATLRIAIALAACSAIVTQMSFSMHQRAASLQNLLSFFTIESNLIAAAAFLIVGTLGLLGRRESESVTMLRGASTVYMITTGVVYSTLLSGNEAAVDSTITWVNLTLHYAMPVILALDWILFASNIARRYGDVLVRWLAFPFVYVLYSLLRGAKTGWYPYPFLNPQTAGYGGVIVTAVAITVFVGLIGFGVAWYGKRPRRAISTTVQATR